MKKIKNIRKRAPRALSFSLSLSLDRDRSNRQKRERERNRATLEKFSNESDFKRDGEKILHNIHISFSPARSRIFIVVSSSRTKKCLLPRCAGTSTRSWPWSVRRRSRRRCSKLNDAKFKRRNVFHQYYTTHASAHISEKRKTCGRDGNKTPRRETRAKRSIAPRKDAQTRAKRKTPEEERKSSEREKERAIKKENGTEREREREERERYTRREGTKRERTFSNLDHPLVARSVSVSLALLRRRRSLLRFCCATNAYNRER